MVATDAASGEKVVIKDGSITDAVKASTCIPGIFNPIKINNKMMIDGGIVEAAMNQPWPITQWRPYHDRFVVWHGGSGPYKLDIAGSTLSACFV